MRAFRKCARLRIEPAGYNLGRFPLVYAWPAMTSRLAVERTRLVRILEAWGMG